MTINALISKKLKFIHYLYAPFIVMVILFIVFQSKNVFPFGSATIDCLDMGQVNVPMYYHMYDAMHGAKSLFFDWYTALGMNMSESVSICSLLSPFNLFFYFVPRESILQSLSLFTMIKMMAMAAAMYVFLHKTFPVNTFWKGLFGVSYSFSGFVLQYYSNSQWLDIAAMFPLLLLATHVMFKKGRVIPYIIMLTLCLIINFYSAAMVLLFLFFIGGLYILLLVPKESRKQKVFLFASGTLSSAGLSAFIVLPAVKQIMESGRMKRNESELVKRLLDIYNTVDYTDKQKWLMLFGTALMLVIIVKGIVAGRKDKRTVLFVAGCVLFVSAQIYFENINLIWHAGSYVAYPLRFGYMISFVLLCAACYYISKSDDLNELTLNKENLPASQIVLRVCFGLAAVYLIVTIVLKVDRHLTEYDYADLFFKANIIAFIVLLAVYAFLLNKHSRFINYRWVSVFLASELLAGAFLFISPAAYATTPWIEGNSNFVYSTNEVRKELDIPPSRLDRVKNIGNTLNANYPFILQRPAISNYTHTVRIEEQQTFRKMGYSIHYTRLLDSGGTVFTDALLNIKHTLATYPLDENMYRFVGWYANYQLYENQYALPFGLVVPDDIASLKKNYTDKFQYQNALFECVSGQKELIRPISLNGTTDPDAIINIESRFSNGNQEIEYTIDIRGNQAVYYAGGHTVQLYVQDQLVPVPSIERDLNTQYPATFNSGLLSLGAFKDQAITLKIISPSISANQVQLGLLDLDKLGALTKEYGGTAANVKTTDRGVSLTATASAGRNMLFLPISYDDGWSCSVNGQNVQVEPIADSFIGIRLQNGSNQVKLTFFPSGMKPGILISLATLLLLAAGLLLQRKAKIKIPELLLTPLEAGFYLVWGTGVAAVYIIPACYTLFQNLLYKV